MAWHTQNVQCMVTLITTTRCHLGHLRPQESSWILAQVPTRALWCSKIFPVTSAKSRTHFPRFPWTPEFFHSHRLCQFFVFCFFLEIPDTKLLCAHKQDSARTVHFVWKIIQKILDLVREYLDIETSCHWVSGPHIRDFSPPSSFLLPFACFSSPSTTSSPFPSSPLPPFLFVSQSLSSPFPSPWSLCIPHPPSILVSNSSVSTMQNGFPFLETWSHQPLEGLGGNLHAQFLTQAFFPY